MTEVLDSARPTRILSLDYLIMDIVISVAENPDIEPLLEKHGITPDSKQQIGSDAFQELSAAVANKKIRTFPGGSSANTLTTVGKILGNRVATAFIGVLGRGLLSSMVGAGLAEAGIERVPEVFPAEATGVHPETAISVVAQFESDKGIGTYPGNATELIKPEILTQELVGPTDIVLIQGSLYRKFDQEVTDRLFDLAREQGAQTWVTLPTTAWNEGKKALIRDRIATNASVVMGNERELASIYGHDDVSDGVKAMIDSMQATTDPVQGNSEPIVFITRGTEGVVVGTRDEVITVPAINLQKGEIYVNPLGAGDSAFAGFMVGNILDLSPEKSAIIGAALGKSNVLEESARIKDPLESLRTQIPHIYREISAVIVDSSIEPRRR